MEKSKPYYATLWFWLAIGWMVLTFFWMWKAHQWHELLDHSINTTNSCIDTAQRCVTMLKASARC